MTIEIQDLVAYDGPNAHSPQPGVLLLLRCDADRGRRLRAALKDGAQSIGLVLGQLDVSAAQGAGGWLVSAFFATPAPAIGAALARYTVDGLRALAAGDEEWDRDGPLYELGRRRRREAPPLALLQTEAEARARGVPSFLRADGRLQLGYGSCGVSLDISELGVGRPPPWEQLGAVPIVAVAGDAARAAAMRHLAEALGGVPGARLLDDAGFDEARALLADPTLMLAVIGLSAATLERRGAPFDRCRLSAALDMPPDTPTGDAELRARALGVPVLLTEPGGAAVLNANEPAIAALAQYARCAVQLVSAADAERLGAEAARAIQGRLRATG
jgi:hypothetical protein